MRYLILLVGLTGLLFVGGCDSSKPSERNEARESRSECTEPENPYSDGTGHYAGYEWAEKNGSPSCSGSSQSFNEGCEEYETQESEYDECESAKKK